MRWMHRWLACLLMIFLVWFSVTGLALQSVDTFTVATNAPATTPNMMAIRESIDGTPNQIVIRPTDYTAAALPADGDLDKALAAVLPVARTTLQPGHGSIDFVELRVEGGMPVIDIGSGPRRLRFSAITAQRLVDPAVPQEARPHSLHGTLKGLHRLFFLGDLMQSLEMVVGLGALALTIIGLRLYYDLWKARRRLRKTNPFWKAGDRWRMLHRNIAIVSAAIILVIVSTGTLLAFDSFAFAVYRAMYPESLINGFAPPGMVGDYSKPLQDGELRPMLATTLRAYHDREESSPIEVVRLRYFAGHSQGVVVGGHPIQQYIFNAQTGAREGLSGEGYPFTGFPTGWALHERLKQIHRGDIIGLPGRALDLLGGLSLAYLSISGAVMYISLWRRRRGAGKPALFWK